MRSFTQFIHGNKLLLSYFLIIQNLNNLMAYFILGSILVERRQVLCLQTQPHTQVHIFLPAVEFGWLVLCPVNLYKSRQTPSALYRAAVDVSVSFPHLLWEVQ